MTPKLRTALFAPLLLCLVAQTPGGKIAHVTFDDDPVGQLPRGFSTAVTGTGQPGAWVVRASDDGKHVLAQTSTDPTDGRFPVCVLDRAVARDVMVDVT